MGIASVKFGAKNAKEKNKVMKNLKEFFHELFGVHCSKRTMT